jgi:splicing factor 3A subunit 1
MSLSLPKPVNTYAGEDELRTNGSATNGVAAGEEDVGEYKAPRMSDRYKQSMIYPPKEMRSKSSRTQ